jgi:uncharacterized membrane protein HdeD (DUF308 family)
MNIITSFRQVVRYWWVFIVLGSSLILFGLLMMAFPVTSFAALGIFFAIAIAINGIMEVGFALANYRTVHGWGWHLAGGVLDLVISGMLFFNPVLMAVSLPIVVGFWLLFRSIAIIGRCFDLPTVWPEKSWMAALGLAGLILSFMIIYNPALGVVSLVILAALSLVSIGLFYIFLGLHLRGLLGQRSDG